MISEDMEDTEKSSQSGRENVLTVDAECFMSAVEPTDASAYFSTSTH